MTATIANLRREIDLRGTSWDGLWLRYRDAGLTIEDIDQRGQRRDLTDDEVQIRADADELRVDIGKEARRRLQHHFGPALRFDDIMEMIG